MSYLTLANNPKVKTSAAGVEAVAPNRPMDHSGEVSWDWVRNLQPHQISRMITRNRKPEHFLLKTKQIFKEHILKCFYSVKS